MPKASLAANATALSAPLQNDAAINLTASLKASIGADAKLEKLADRIEALCERRENLNKVCDLCAEQMDPTPDPPSGLWFRPHDFPAICDDPAKLATYKIEGAFVGVYEAKEDLTVWAARYWDKGDGHNHYELSLANVIRLKEIVSAHGAWQAEIKAAEEAAGVTANMRAAERADAQVQALTREMIAIPSETTAGLIAKARAAAAIKHLPRERYAEALDNLLQKPGRVDWEAVASLMLLVDAVRLAGGGQ